MSLTDSLLRFYLSLESRYYAACDSLERKGLKIYEYFITPLESRGVPSFPVAAAIIFILIASILVIAFSSMQPVSQTVYIKVTGTNGIAIEGATVSLLAIDDAVVFSAVTNSTGEVFFPDKANALRFSVTAEGYRQFQRPIISRAVIQLQAIAAEQPRPVQPIRGLNFSQIVEQPQFGSFVIRLRANENIVNGAVRAIDASTDSVIEERSTVNGAALFENLQLNQRIYFTASASGYVYNATPQEFIVNRGRQNIVLEMQRAASVAAMITIVSNSTSSPLAGVLVRLYDENNAPIANSSTNVDGRATFDLPLGKMYYFNARKSSYITAVSPKFSPSDQQLSLQAENERNAATLHVNIRNEYNDTISATATIYTLDNRVIEQSSFQRSRHEFSFLPRGSAFTVVAAKNDKTANASVTLANSVNSIILNLESGFASLSITATDLFTGRIVAARAEVKRNGESLDSCATPCNLTVKTRGIHELKVTADSYFDYEFTFGATRDAVVFVENSFTSINATLMPLRAVENSAVRFDGVYDAITFERIAPGSALKQNRLYAASLSAFYANATLAGLYFSPSDSAPSDIEILRFKPLPEAADSPEGLEVSGSTSSDPTSCGTSLPASNIRRLLFNIPLSAGDRISQPYLFYFVAQSTRADSLVVKYKSFIRQPGGAYVRNPFDAVLGTAMGQSNGDRSECAAKAFNSTYKLVSTNIFENEFGKMSLYFSQQRRVGSITTSDYPEQCGEAALNVRAENPYEFVDCDGFNVDSGFQLLSVHFSLNLANPTRAGVIRFTSNPVYFSVVNASFTSPGRLPLYLAHGEAGIFEIDVTPLLASRDGRTRLDGVINLSTTGSALRSEIQVEFVQRNDNGSLGYSLSKIAAVKLNPVTLETGANLLAGYSCGSGPVKFSYDEGLIDYEHSGWSGCGEIPLVVDSIFPADAVPIFIENTTSSQDCAITRGDAVVWGVENGGITPQVDDTECFSLESGNDVAKYNLQVPDGFKPYVLKFNALRPQCTALHGNTIEARRTTLRFACGGRRTTRNGVSQPYDEKIVNITLLNASGAATKGLKIHPLVDSYQAREFSLSAGGIFFYPAPSEADPSNPVSNCPGNSTLVRAYQDAEYPTIFRDILEYMPNATYTVNGSVRNGSCDLKNSTGSCKGFGIYPELAKVGKFSFNRDLSLLRASPSPENRSLTPAMKGLSYPSSLFGTRVKFNYTPDITSGGFIAYDYCAVSNVNHEDKSPPFGNNYAFAVVGQVNHSTQLEPQLWVVVNNLQNLGLSQPRDSLQFTGTVEPIPITDVGSGVALAVDSRYVKRFENDLPKLDLAENGIPLTGNAFSPADDLVSKIYTVNAAGGKEITKPVLSYVTEAKRILASTALRRSRATFYCQAGGVDPANPSQCRPTIGDWLVTVQASDFVSESCQVCSPSTCDAQCDPVTHTYPDGRFCGNYCAAPQCYSADQCVDGQRRVAITGRSVSHWENSTPLVEQILATPDNDAPLKYFRDELQGMFNYTVVVNLGDECSDTQGDLEAGSGNCFAPSRLREQLTDFDPTNEVQLSRLKVKEFQGGCEYSDKWNRGYYKATFSYVYDSELNRWKWRYYLEPLEISSAYLQAGDYKCSSPLLAGNRRSQLCYYTFSTNSSLVGNCVRSLRDYIPQTFDPAEREANGILLSELTNFDSKFGGIQVDHTPETLDPAVYRYVRNLDLYSSNALKCDRFNSNPFIAGGKIPIILTKDYRAVPPAYASQYAAVRGLVGTNAMPYSFGVDKRGNLDYFKNTASVTCSRVYSGSTLRTNVDAVYNVQDVSTTQANDNTCFAVCRICHGDECGGGLRGTSDWWPFW